MPTSISLCIFPAKCRIHKRKPREYENTYILTIHSAKEIRITLDLLTIVSVSRVFPSFDLFCANLTTI